MYTWALHAFGPFVHFLGQLLLLQKALNWGAAKELNV